MVPLSPPKLEDDDDRKSGLRYHVKSEPEENWGDRIVTLLKKRGMTPRTSDQAAKAEGSKPEIPTNNLVINNVPVEPVLADSGTRPPVLSVTARGRKKALAKVEVVVPRWKDVLRRKRRESRSHPHHGEPQYAPGQEETGGHDARGVENGDIKVESVEESKPLTPEGERHSAATLAWAIQEMRHPDIKVKKELLLSDEYLLDALAWDGINYRYPIPVPPDIAEHPLPRAYIANLYGGNLQSTFVEPRKDFVDWHGLKYWAFLTLDWNPHAPTRPGVSGLFFAGGGDHEDDRFEDPKRTFVRVRPGKWVYMGQYRLQLGKPLTRESWKQQSELTRRTWAKAYLQWASTSYVSIRIWLRKKRGSDHEPTRAEYETATTKEIQSSVTEEDIIAAFDRGEEEMHVYTMTCVGYDEEFIRCLVRNVPRWVSPAPKKTPQHSAPETSVKKSKEGTRSKRKPIEGVSDAEESNGGADKPWTGKEDEDDVKVAGSAETEPERRSTRHRVKRVRTS